MEMEDGLSLGGHSSKKSVMGEDDTVINFNFDLSDLVGGLDDLSDDDEIEIVDDSETSDLGGSEVSPPSSDEMDDDHLDLGHDEMDDDEIEMDDEETPEEKPSLSESVRGRKPAKGSARVSAKTSLAENRALKAQLAEQTLFNTKVVHLQPFLNNRNLTKEQKQKIVEYLDSGRTVNEVKTIYTRVKTVLESAQKAKAKAGSSSRPSGAGAATLNESINVENLYEGAVLVEAEKNRLMELAGIRRK
jgi:hypothetical protein